MQSNVTIVITVFNLKDKRLRNFSFLLENYLSKLDVKIIIAEQVKKNSYKTTVSLLESLKCSKIIYKQFEVDKTTFYKSYILNRASELVKTKYMWPIDADVFFKYRDVLDQIENQDVICPYNYVLLLTEKDTQKFIKDKKFVAKKGRKFNAIQKFGPLSFIIKTKLFKEYPMNEEFTGYGWEDLDFAYRVSRNLDIVNLSCNGLHLYHDIAIENKKQEKHNRQIFFKNRQALSFKNLRMPKESSKNIKNKSLLDIFNKTTSNIEIAKIVHIITPALLPNKTDLYKRELLAIESIIEEKRHFNNITCIMFSDNPECEKYKNEFKIVIPPRSSKNIGDNRGLPYLPDILKEACRYCSKDDIIFYTNSDCCLSAGTYNRLENTKTFAVEYHRRDVLNNPESLSDVFLFPNELKEKGVDGIAFRKGWFLNNPHFVPDFFIGEPHWDTAICGALRTAGVSSQNTIDLYHPFHEQTWNTSCLSLAGKQNDKLYRDFLEYGVSKIKILSKPEEKIKTSIVLVHYGDDKKRVNAAKIAMGKLPYQNILNTEFVFVEVVKDKTSFLEIDSKPNWTHIIIKEKEENRDIFQKEAMMNIGAKRAKGNVVIFIDNDIWTDNSNWLNSISVKIQENPNKIVQGFSFCQDSKNADLVFVSALLNTCKNIESDLHENPGLVLGMSKNILIKNNYLNIYNIMGGGDSIILHEYLSPKYPHLNAWWQMSFPKLKSIVRDLSLYGICDYIDINIIHENHGDVDPRYYGARHYATEYFTKEICKLLILNKNGLLEWENPECIERKMVKNKLNMTSKKDVIEIYKRIIK